MRVGKFLQAAASLAVSALAASLLMAATARADPGYYVVTVYDDPGRRTLDFRYWSVNPDGGHAVLWPEVGAGLNVNGRWYTELLGSYIAARGLSLRLDTLNWQNDVLLTQGQYPFDLAVHSLIVVPQLPFGRKTFELGPVFQTDVGRTQLNLNAFFEAGYGSDRHDPVLLKYQWQVRHRWQRGLHVGAQGFGELGPWDDWSPHGQQSHRAGPALFGSWALGAGELSWQTALLFGKTYAQPGTMFTARVKYDF